tara:strand:+ start:748 stop:1110 length:363 start_codon:yes stop_codon:yes gene_type:complete
MGKLQDYQLDLYERYGDVALSAWTIVTKYPFILKEVILKKVLGTDMTLDTAKFAARNEIFLEICEIIQEGSSEYTLDALEYMQAFERGYTDDDQAEAEMWTRAEAQMTKEEFERIVGPQD